MRLCITCIFATSLEFNRKFVYRSIGLSAAEKRIYLPLQIIFNRLNIGMHRWILQTTCVIQLVTRKWSAYVQAMVPCLPVLTVYKYLRYSF
jgi:hypothetical protein